MTDTVYCFCSGCRFSETHLSKAHLCGKCKKFGHGQRECGSPYKIAQIAQQSRGIRFPDHLRCQAPGCRQAYSHTSGTHICSKCKGRHFETECITQPSHDLSPTSEKFAQTEGLKLLRNTPGQIFSEVYAGMGCQWFVRRSNQFSPISVFFMHTDSWGQYGPQCDDRQKLVKFLTGYTHVSTGHPFRLPRS
jgi:hypothetical protein